MVEFRRQHLAAFSMKAPFRWWQGTHVLLPISLRFGMFMLLMVARLDAASSKPSPRDATAVTPDQPKPAQTTKTEAVSTAAVSLSKQAKPATRSANGVLYLEKEAAFVRVANSPSLNTCTNAITLEAWIKPSSFSMEEGDAHTILRKNILPGRANYYLRLRVAAGRPILEISAGTDVGRLQAAHPFDLDTWYHVAGTYDGVRLSLYVNGTLVTNRSATGALHSDASDLFIGLGDPSSRTGEYFHGCLDEIRLWSVARSPEQIRAGMGAVLVGSEPGLEACWNFDDHTAKDESPHGNHGQLSGARIERSLRITPAEFDLVRQRIAQCPLGRPSLHDLSCLLPQIKPAPIIFLGESPRHGIPEVKQAGVALAIDLARHAQVRVVGFEWIYGMHPFVEAESLGQPTDKPHVEPEILRYNASAPDNRKLLVTALDIEHSLGHADKSGTIRYLENLANRSSSRESATILKCAITKLPSLKNANELHSFLNDLQVLFESQETTFGPEDWEELTFSLALMHGSVDFQNAYQKEARGERIGADELAFGYDRRAEFFRRTIERALLKARARGGSLVCYVGGAHAIKTRMKQSGSLVQQRAEAAHFHHSHPATRGQVKSILIQAVSFQGQHFSRKWDLDDIAYDMLRDGEWLYMPLAMLATPADDLSWSQYFSPDGPKHDGILFIKGATSPDAEAKPSEAQRMESARLHEAQQLTLLGLQQQTMRMEDEAIAAFKRAEAILQETGYSSSRALLAYYAACAHSRLGQKREALASLRRSVGLGFMDVEHIRGDPDLVSLHEDPAFQQLLADIEAKRAEPSPP